MDFTDEHGNPLSERELRELAAYADGTLKPSRADGVARRAVESPARAALIDEQLLVGDAIRSIAVEAPASLRAEIARRRAPQRLTRRRRLALPAGAVVALAALAAVVVVALGGGSSGPSIVQAAQLAERGATQPAPLPEATDRRLLTAAVDGVHYPYWGDALGWHPRGARADRLAGRLAATVYYSDRAGARVGYTIVAGAPLRIPAGAHRYRVRAVRFAAFALGARTVVTWRRQGHTCVLSAQDVPVRTMLTLAAWQSPKAV